MAWFVEWFVFTGIAAYLLYDGYRQTMSSEKSIRLLLSFLFWVASGYQWNIDHPGNDLMLIHVAMILISLSWTLTAMGNSLQKDETVKRKI